MAGLVCNWIWKAKPLTQTYTEKVRSAILVTGAHRSGTTWVGKMLCASNEAAYISEPLNVLHRPGVFRAPVKYWYTVISASDRQSEEQYLPAYQELLRFQYHLGLELKSLRSRKDFLRMGRDLGIFIQGRLLRQRPLLKDPFAIFSTPWFIERLGCQVVVTLRHPLAFVSSLKRLGWSFSFEDLLAQPLLMESVGIVPDAKPGLPLEAASMRMSTSEGGSTTGQLAPFRNEIEDLLAREAESGAADIITQASLLWKIIYQVVAELQQRFPQIHVVRHEDLSLDPLGSFGNLYKALSLTYTARAQEKIRASSASENPKEGSQRNAFAVRLDSRANLSNWKKRLTPDEIERIRSITETVAARYYSDYDWE